MMNNKIYAALSAVLLLAGCTKIPVLSDQPFTITIKSELSQAIWADIIPESNDFVYFVGTVSVAEYEQKYNNDEALVRDVDSENKGHWQEYLKDIMSFRDSYLYSGAYFVKFTDLKPETDYYVYAFPYDDNDNPVCKVVKQKVTTKSYNPSEIDFTVSMQGSVISVTPSNNDSYYYDFDTVESVEKDYGGDPLVFYNYLVYKYEEYGFMPELTRQGADESDIAEYFTLTPGQEYYLVASGYDNGINSPYCIFKLTYNGESVPGTVRRILSE